MGVQVCEGCQGLGPSGLITLSLVTIGASWRRVNTCVGREEWAQRVGCTQREGCAQRVGCVQREGCAQHVECV